MISRLMNYCKGHIRIRVVGGAYERFLNLCAYNKIQLWDLESTDGSYEMNISLKDLKKIRPFVRKSRTKVRIVKKYGLPFFLYRNRRRKLTGIGIIMGCFLLWVMTCFIWNVTLEGNHQLTQDLLLDFLSREQVIQGTPKSKIDCKSLAAKMRLEFDQLVWVSVRIQGTRLCIDVQENTDLELKERVEYDNSDLVSNMDGQVVKIITRSGIPQVSVGDKVHAGDLLVSGEIPIYNDSQEIAGYQYCAADADIYLKTDYYYEDTLPLVYQAKEYTGQQQTGGYIKLGGHYLSFPGWKRNFQDRDILRTEEQLKLSSNFYLPVSLGQIVEKEYKIITKIYTKDDAKALLEEKLFQNIEKFKGKGVQLFENNVKIESSGQQCTAKGVLTVIEKAGKRVKRISQE